MLNFLAFLMATLKMAVNNQLWTHLLKSQHQYLFGDQISFKSDNVEFSRLFMVAIFKMAVNEQFSTLAVLESPHHFYPCHISYICDGFRVINPYVLFL